MDMKEDVATLLSAGFSSARVADMLSIKVSTVENFLKDDSFASRVRSGVTQKVIGGIGRDDKIDKIQELLLTEMEERLEFGDIGQAKISTLANLFRIVNGAKKVVEPGQSQGDGNGAKVVNIVLPAYMKVHTVEHTVNQNNEVITVEGRSMLTMSPNMLKNLAERAESDIVEAELVERNVVKNTNNRTVRLEDLVIPDTSVAAGMERVAESSRTKANQLFVDAAAKRLAKIKGEAKAEQAEVSSAVGAEPNPTVSLPASELAVSVSGDEQDNSISAQAWSVANE